MKQIEFNNMHVPLLDYDRWEVEQLVAYEVKKIILEAICPFRIGQRRKVVREFSPLISYDVTWTEGTTLQILSGGNDSGVFCRPLPHGKALTAWKNDMLFNTEVIVSL